MNSCHGPASRELTLLPNSEHLSRARKLRGQFPYFTESVKLGRQIEGSTAGMKNTGKNLCKMPAQGASGKASGLGLEIWKSRGSESGEDQRDPRKAFPLS